MKNNVDIKPLKKFVSERFPTTSLLRKVILHEDDIISINSFIERVEVWLNLIDEEN